MGVTRGFKVPYERTYLLPSGARLRTPLAILGFNRDFNLVSFAIRSFMRILLKYIGNSKFLIFNVFHTLVIL